jgi:hypothetical protein
MRIAAVLIQRNKPPEVPSQFRLEVPSFTRAGLNWSSVGRIFPAPPSPMWGPLQCRKKLAAFGLSVAVEASTPLPLLQHVASDQSISEGMSCICVSVRSGP